MKTPQIIPARFAAALIFPVLAVVLALPAIAQYPASFTWRETTLRGDNYQSHNQTIVWTANGLFRSGDQQTGWPSYHPNDNVIVERSNDGGTTWNRIFDTGIHRDNLKLRTITDRPMYELWGGEGEVHRSNYRFEGSKEIAAIRLLAEGGEAVVKSFRVDPMKSIW